MLDAKLRMGLRFLIFIADPSVACKAEKIFRHAGIRIQYRCYGRGTATSDVLDYLGLEGGDKEILLCVAPKEIAKKLLAKLTNVLYLREPGNGIAFTLPVDGVSNPVIKLLDAEVRECVENKAKKEVEQVAEQAGYSLILAVTNQGYSEDMMKAARASGAKGGTVLHARRLGLQDTLSFWGINVQEEREITVILAPRDMKTNIMRVIGEKYGHGSEAHGLVLSLPVDAVEGISEENEDD